MDEGANGEQAASRVVWRGQWELPQALEAQYIAGRLGKARCRAARACRGLRAAVREARDLGAFRHWVQSVAAGGGHTVVCTGDAVFSFGDGTVGQLGYEAANQATPRVVAGLLDEDVVAAAASACSTLVCTGEGRAYWFGELLELSFHVIIQSRVPRLLGGLERVVGVTAGENHLLAWTGSGELYTWGVGYHGQLGHGSKAGEAGPRLVEGLAGQQVVGADGGRYHSVACTASGRVYTFGRGRLTLGHGQDASGYQLTPRLVEGLAGSTVVAVAAGNGTTAAVTEAGELYTWGYSDTGALGHEQENIQVSLPRLVAGQLAGRRVAGVVAGVHHMLAWTDSGELYSWGERGRLGHNSTDSEWSPRRVEGLAGKAVVGAAAGSNHSVVITREQQQVHTFGKGDEGRLGHGSTQSESTPRLLAGLKMI